MVQNSERTWAGSMAEAYDQWLVPTLFQPFAFDIARRVATFDPERVLEIAAGTGVVTRELTKQSAEIVATDLSPVMTAVGQHNVPDAKWQEADAMQLPFGDDEFDVIVCQFGAMFFPDKTAAFKEARRVLKSGGTFVFNVWDTIANSDFATAVDKGLTKAFPEDGPTFLNSVPHAFGDTSVMTNYLNDAGFENIEADAVRLEARTESAASMVRAFVEGTPLSVEVQDRTDDVEGAKSVIIEEAVSQLNTDSTGAATGSMSAHVFTARKP